MRLFDFTRAIGLFDDYPFLRVYRVDWPDMGTQEAAARLMGVRVGDLFGSGVRTIMISDDYDGFIGVCQYRHEYGPEGRILAVAVHPTWRGLGVGGTLVDEAADTMGREGALLVYGPCRDGQREWAERLGFQTTPPGGGIRLTDGRTYRARLPEYPCLFYGEARS